MKISLIIPTLGERKKEMERLMESIIIQEACEIEVIVVSQKNSNVIQQICEKYIDNLEILHLTTDKRGLSHARNIGIERSTGDIILLSDDDCWYKKDAFKTIINFFETYNCDVLLTQIYDPINKCSYKKYPSKKRVIKFAYELLSKSSIEIAYINKKLDHYMFDERFGLGAKYPNAEETDFLIRCWKEKKRILFVPYTTVFHLHKETKIKQRDLIRVKGALYAKDLNVFCGILVVIKDFVLRHENNFGDFWRGYCEFKKQNG